MARFSGKVGYGLSAEVAQGIWKPVITERVYYGDVIRESRQLQRGDHTNPDLSLNNRISIVADDFANLNIQAIRYVILDGAYWTVNSVEIQRPRLILSIGGPYNGPKA